MGSNHLGFGLDRQPRAFLPLIDMLVSCGRLRAGLRACFLYAMISLLASPPAHAQLGASDAQLKRLLGTPIKTTGDMVYFHKPPKNYVIHMHQGACDQICVFSDSESGGFPEPLSEQDIEDVLHQFGGGSSWSSVNRLSMNRVWSSTDRKSFAIYETIYNKLVLMTREAYRRDRSARH